MIRPSFFELGKYFVENLSPWKYSGFKNSIVVHESWEWHLEGGEPRTDLIKGVRVTYQRRQEGQSWL